MESQPKRVVALGAICDLVVVTDDGRTTRFSISEYAELSDGTQTILHNDLGMTSGWRGLGPDEVAGVGDLRETVSSLRETVLALVGPDEDDGEDHPWEWLADLAQSKGLEVAPQELRSLPYNVVFTPAVAAMTRPG